MKKLGLFVFGVLFAASVVAKDAGPKTFLILFTAKELKEWKVSLKDLESQFPSFKTKSYSGNSELALIIDIPSCDFDECFLGQFLIEVGRDREIKLQDIAFRMVDMTEKQKSLEVFVASYEESLKKKGTTKSERAIPAP